MNETPKSEDNLTDEFRTLGQNLLDTLHAAWERPERKKLQQEIETGLSELVSTLKGEADSFAESPAGQKVKTEVDDFRQRVRTGEADAAVRSELLKVLQTVNAELKKAAVSLGVEETTTENKQSDNTQED